MSPEAETIMAIQESKMDVELAWPLDQLTIFTLYAIRALYQYELDPEDVPEAFEKALRAACQLALVTSDGLREEGGKELADLVDFTAGALWYARGSGGPVN